VPRKLLTIAAILVAAGFAATPAAFAAAPAGAIVDGPDDPQGTVILAHASAWQGRYDDPYYHDAKREIYEFIGHQLAARGWRVVSVEYAAGEAGLADVEAAVRSELADRPDTPLCLYGESSGGHLSLMAAAEIPQVSCVIAVGAPTDLTTWQPQATSAGLLPNVLSTIESVTAKVFGTLTDTLRAWSPAYRARTTAADVLLARESDDWIVPAAQVTSFTERQPTARALSIPGVAPHASGAIERVHGWWSAAARNELIGAVASTLDRTAAGWPVVERARATGCADANTPALELSPARLDRSAACLARSIRRAAKLPGRIRGAGAAIAGPHRLTASVSLTGNVTPARAVWGLLGTRAGASALRKRTARTLHLSIRLGTRSRAQLQVR
jgi:acetyl esterase/lipase